MFISHYYEAYYNAGWISVYVMCGWPIKKTKPVTQFNLNSTYIIENNDCKLCTTENNIKSASILYTYF